MKLMVETSYKAELMVGKYVKLFTLKIWKLLVDKY